MRCLVGVQTEACSDGISKAKAQLVLGQVKGNEKGFHRYINNKRKELRGSVGHRT